MTLISDIFLIYYRGGEHECQTFKTILFIMWYLDEGIFFCLNIFTFRKTFMG